MARANKPSQSTNELTLSDPERQPGDPDYKTRVRKFLRLPEDSEISLVSSELKTRGRTVVQYSFVRSIELKGAEWGVAEGVWIDERAVASLTFGREGNLVDSSVNPADSAQLEQIKDNIRKLAANGQIAAEPTTGSKVGQVKPWQVSVDAQGRKRLKRAHFN